MSLLVPWKGYRPDDTPPACPRCGAVPNEPYVVVRHDSASPDAERVPAWLDCRDCGHRYAAGIYTLRKAAGE